MFVIGQDRQLQYEYPVHARQSSNWECGDLAVAKAIFLLHGQNLESINFALPHDLRKHTAKIILSGQESLYPTRNRKTRKTKPKQCSLDLICNCRLPQCYSQTISCSNQDCGKEYHKICIDSVNMDVGLQKTWLCAECKK